MPDQESNADLNVLSEDPLCAGVFLPNLNVPISPTEGHFIRSHLSAPQINSAEWFLPVTGEINNELNLSYNDLLKMPDHEVVSLMECAGNSRSTM